MLLLNVIQAAEGQRSNKFDCPNDRIDILGAKIIHYVEKPCSNSAQQVNLPTGSVAQNVLKNKEISKRLRNVLKSFSKYCKEARKILEARQVRAIKFCITKTITKTT